jgi:hypothetical protein
MTLTSATATCDIAIAADIAPNAIVRPLTIQAARLVVTTFAIVTLTVLFRRSDARICTAVANMSTLSITVENEVLLWEM